MSYRDIREFLAAVESDGELKQMGGVDCDLEMSGICEILYREGRRPVPALLFDDIPGYPKGYRTLFGLLSSPRRIAKALCLPEKEFDSLQLARNWRRKSGKLQLIPPDFIDSGSVSENILSGNDIDLTRFPVPRFHELDGGRYIGTGNIVILKDPDEDWINVGVYRCMLADRNRMVMHILEGQQGGTICHDRYFARGLTMPVAVAIGVDPALWFASAHNVPWGTSEYDYAGGVRGEPVEVIKGPYTGLPLPAHAEIVIEGECHPGDLMDEGPFGEWCGYYANLGLSPVPEPVIHVKTILHRHDPILTCANPAMPRSELTELSCLRRTSEIWSRLERSGVSGIKAVWCHEEGGGPLFNVVSIQQRYAGHARETGLIASQFAGHNGRYTVVVDEDIDPTDLRQVVWAIATRADPACAIQILDRQRSTSADTTISPEEKRKIKTAPKPLLSSRAIIDACQPFEWRNEWYPVARITHELRLKLMNKWKSLFEEFI